MKKRGIESLVATVFFVLIVIVLIAGISVFLRNNVVQSFIKGESAFEGFQNCNEIKYRVEGAYCDPEKESIVLVRVNNEKNIDFKDSYIVRFFYPDGDGDEIGTFLYDTRLLAYESKDIGISRPTYDEGVFGEKSGQFRPIQSLELVPKIKAGREFVLCNDKKQN